ncbi:EAL domain-containing protein [Noviherbaspirillum sp. ST9]|uniref:EAL domain-containing protein n=1 Tax=Noviherbaspirillum sp. ST9 TaxID=3401606 RepID=UPI003B589382
MGRQRISLKKSNCILSMLSRINRAIVRAESPDDLFRAACQIAVESGLFSAAWVGLVAPHSRTLQVLCHTGEIGSVDRVLARPGGFPDTVRTAGEMRILDKPETRTAALFPLELVRHGIHAMAGLPLYEHGRVVAVLTVFATDPGCFDAAVTALLHEVTEDICFSLDHQLSEQHRLAAESKLYYMASYDAQTGMPNRSLLEERLPALAARAEQRGAFLTMFAMRLMRLDRVAQIIGPAATNDVMRTIALRLEDLRGADGLLAQLGHEEFALVTLGARDSADVESLARTMVRAVEQPVHLDGKEVFLHLAVGGVTHWLHDQDVTTLLRRARAAANQVGAEGGFRLYSPDLDRDLERHVEMEAELHRALERGEFELHYQPQLNMKSGMVVGVEALLRWRHPLRGLIPPNQFIPLLEECGLMSRVGTWVLRTACAQAREWQELGLPAIRMAVNLSAQQFRLADLVTSVAQALGDAGLAPEALELELTESLILENAEQTIQVMHDLKKLGVSLSLDDFGTGYSSLSYLRRYPVDRIKIDQSFVRDIMEHSSSAALVRSILSMAHNLGLATIAEGVETPAQLGYLRKQVCQEMQGFLFSKPLPADELTEMLRQGRGLASDDPVDAAASTLLIVDDEAVVLKKLSLAFRSEGWKILTAGSGEEALVMMWEHGVGVVVSDLQMHGMPGTEFLRRVREMYPMTVRTILTRHADFETVAEAVNAGNVYKVLSKSSSIESLRGDLRDAFRRYEAKVEYLRRTGQQAHADNGKAAKVKTP